MEICLIQLKRGLLLSIHEAPIKYVGQDKEDNLINIFLRKWMDKWTFQLKNELFKINERIIVD